MGSSSSITVIIFCFLFFFLLEFDLGFGGPVVTHSIQPNFTASYFQFIDQSGDFLSSRNGTFKATLDNSGESKADFFFSVVHVASNAVVWSLNPGFPISSSTELALTPRGLSIVNETTRLPIWSTPELRSPVAYLRLLDSGNLVLLDSRAAVLWQSFDHPSDTLVPAQRLPAGKRLSSPAGDYSLEVTTEDAVLRWRGLTYWKLSMQANAFKLSNLPVSFMAVNQSGFYLMAADGSTTVYEISLQGSSAGADGGAADFAALRLGGNGSLTVRNHADFSAPSGRCDLPMACHGLGLCDPSSAGCTCPTGFVPGFVKKYQDQYACLPVEKSISLPESSGKSCENDSRPVSYLNLGGDVDYFANNFVEPLKEGFSLSECQNLCSRKCSCLAVFHQASSGSCYLVQNHLGSLVRTSGGKLNRTGYVKTLVAPPSIRGSGDDDDGFPVAALVLLPTTGVFLIVGVALLATIWLKRKRFDSKSAKLRRWNSSSSAEMEEISIPGLPVRFDYDELAEATVNFTTQIGSGGFGTVYKGTLKKDNAVIAVKRMSSLGVRGKKDFATEITIIGNIHHVNLVRLKGFCAQGRHRLLVMEYMNKGSLDRVLFGHGNPVLEWKERFEIALGTARGLAYLHSGCEHKIIHCDVKPENILLHHQSDSQQPQQVKISDFGLSKLLSPEQSCLFTTMRGTRGYLAPEWLASSSISDKADVYSYGMVLLEIIRGKKNSSPLSRSSDKDSSAKGGGESSSASSEAHQAAPAYFPLVALEMHEQRRYLELADPRLEGRVAEEEVEKATKIALCCVHEDPALRPSMATVVSMLEGGVAVWEPRVESLNFLRFYGRRFTEASQNADESKDEQNEFVMWKSGTTASYNSLSYISSHQLSGPR